MAKVIYELTCDPKNLNIVDGKVVVTFEREVDIEDINNAESSGEYQGNMLWECFEHNFTSQYDDGVEVQYNDDGDRI